MAESSYCWHARHALVLLPRLLVFREKDCATVMDFPSECLVISLSIRY